MKPTLFLCLFLLLFNCSLSTTKSYSSLLKETQTKREVFRKAYLDTNCTNQDSIIHAVQVYLLTTVSEDFFPAWYGTPWDFDGMTETPQQGNIACGYFVTTILRDLGFTIPRIKWAQSASEVFIKKLANTTDIKRFYDKPISQVENHLQKSGDGLYVVGLDVHVGFILVKNNNAEFIHANYYQADIGVMSETIDSENALSDSRYRVIGKLFSDDMIVNWLCGNRYY